MSEVTISIDGIEVQAPLGAKLLPAALNAGINILHACYVPDIDPPVKECLLCVVKVNGHIVTACNEPIVEGMMVITSNPELESLRRKRLHFPG